MKTLMKLFLALSVVTLGGCSVTPADAHQNENPGSAQSPSMRAYVKDRKMFCTMMEEADMMDRLDQPQTTLLLPTEESLSAISEKEFQALMSDSERLNRTLQDHFVEGTLPLSRLADSGEVMTDTGLPLVVSRDESGDVLVAGIPIISSDQVCSNGIVHEIDGLLLDLVEEEGVEEPIEVETIPLQDH